MKTSLTCLFFLLTIAPVPARAQLAGSPAAQEVKRAFDEEKKKIDAARLKGLRDLASKNLADAKTLLAAKKRSGNITGLAIGNKAVEIFEQCLKQLDEKADFELPAEVRRELTQTVDACAQAKKKIEDEHATALKDLEAKYAEQLGEKLRAQGSTEITEAQMGEFLKGLLPRDSAAQPAVSTNAPTPPPAATGGSSTNAPLPTPDVVKSSGAADTWVTIARWHASVADIELISIPVIDRREKKNESVKDNDPGQPYETRYEPVRVLPPGEGYVFQIRNLAGCDAPEVEEWPTRGNNWNLTVRARPIRVVPSKHGIEIQVSFPGAEQLTAIAGAEGEDTAGAGDAGKPTVRVKINSIPDGAVVYLDGSPYRQGNDTLKTPCVAPITARPHNIRLRKFGYLDAVINQFEPAEGKVINWTFEKDSSTADKILKVSARLSWQNTGVTVKKGDRLFMHATNMWSCGSNKEPIDAEGYPNSKKYYTYYLNPASSPRQLNSANYGALIMRIGKEGLIRTVGREYQGTADADGTIYLDINEVDGVEARRDNAGTLTVRLRKAPPRGD